MTLSAEFGHVNAAMISTLKFRPPVWHSFNLHAARMTKRYAVKSPRS